MEKYKARDVKRLTKFIEDLKASKPKDNYLVSITKLTNLLNKVGVIGPVCKAGSKRQFSHELLKDFPGVFDGTFLMTEAHGKRDMMHFRNFQHYCLKPIEYLIDRIEKNDLIDVEHTEEDGGYV